MVSLENLLWAINGDPEAVADFSYPILDPDRVSGFISRITDPQTVVTCDLVSNLKNCLLEMGKSSSSTVPFVALNPGEKLCPAEFPDESKGYGRSQSILVLNPSPL